MSTSWYPGHDTREGWEIAVDNPGHGTLWIRTLGADLPEWQAELRGEALGEFLEALTVHAVQIDPPAGLLPPRPLPPFLTPERAHVLLPAFQKAVVLAGSGTDRYDRMFPDVDDGPPAEPLCVNCGKGSPYTPGETVSEWCATYGHTVFGQDGGSWELAVERHRRERAWWERMRDLRESLPAAAGGSA